MQLFWLGNVSVKKNPAYHLKQVNNVVIARNHKSIKIWAYFLTDPLRGNIHKVFSL